MTEQQQGNYDVIGNARREVRQAMANYLLGSTFEYAGLLSGVYSAATFFSEGVNEKSVSCAILGLLGYAGGRLIQHATREINSSGQTTKILEAEVSILKGEESLLKGQVSILENQTNTSDRISALEKKLHKYEN